MEEKDLLEFLAKMVLYAPEVWSTIVTGEAMGAGNDYANIGVAFDASSRLRRAGLEYYHEKLTEKWMGERQEVCHIAAGGALVGDF